MGEGVSIRDASVKKGLVFALLEGDWGRETLFIQGLGPPWPFATLGTAAGDSLLKYIPYSLTSGSVSFLCAL